MISALTLLHRWLGVAFCLLFAMWFATGIVMHFVPFPTLAETERFAGLAPIDLAGVKRGPAEAAALSDIGDVKRVRLVQRDDGPVYLVSGGSAVEALHGSDLADGTVRSASLALAIARDTARQRNLNGEDVTLAALAAYDQWTVSERFDPHRPLYRVALNDRLGTELYVSSTTGEVVLVTRLRERAWNYIGSIAHWIYPVALRSHPAGWTALLWWLSLLALIGASSGAVIGMLRIGFAGSRPVSRYSGWQAWHHWLGLCCMPFVLSWIFSGFLSMDSGQLFSTGKPTPAEQASITGAPVWNALLSDEIAYVSAPVREVEWFAFGGRIYRRERASVERQQLFVSGELADAIRPDRALLRRDEIAAAVGNLALGCEPPVIIGPNDDYAATSVVPGARVFRVVCGRDWYQIDGPTGALLEKLDPSRRAYHWFYAGLHTLDFPVLTARPALRAALIVILCVFGFAFSLTGVVIAGRRLLIQSGHARRR